MIEVKEVGENYGGECALAVGRRPAPSASLGQSGGEQGWGGPLGSQLLFPPFPLLRFISGLIYSPGKNYIRGGRRRGSPRVPCPSYFSRHCKFSLAVLPGKRASGLACVGRIRRGLAVDRSARSPIVIWRP